MIKRLLALLAVFVLAAALYGCGASETAAVVDGVQVISVRSDGNFVPSASAAAGTPIRLEFGPGSGCTAAIQFPERGIYEDLTDGGGVVELPALTAGEYPLLCQSNMVMGVLEVE